MPELPEVETVRRGLDSLLRQNIFKSFIVYDSPKSFPNTAEQAQQFLCGATVLGVRRRAKVLMIDLSTSYSLVIHLKMTGQLVFRPVIVKDRAQMHFGGGHPSDSLIGSLPDRSTRVEFAFTDGSKLFFNDQRKFGWVKLLPKVEIANLPFMQRVGPEPLDETTTAQMFIDRIRRRPGTCVKPAILDQSVIAGVGNIYADESLWAAKIHPQTRVAQLSDDDFKRLFHELKLVLQLSIDQGGSTDRNYVDAEGNKGNYLRFAHVFRRQGEPCHRHPDQEILKYKVAGRGTHICPICQVRIGE